MITSVWLIRHGQVKDHTVFHGAESDVDLSPLGYLQAQAVAPIVANYRPEIIISSGMKRAIHTAEPIAMSCHLPLQIEPLLHERKVGRLVGTPANGELGIWPETLERWVQGDIHHSSSGAESYADLQNRIIPIWQRITTVNAGKRIIVVAHGIVNRVIILSVVKNLGLSDWGKIGKIGNTSITELRKNQDGWSAIKIGEIVSAVSQLNQKYNQEKIT